MGWRCDGQEVVMTDEKLEYLVYSTPCSIFSSFLAWGR